MRARSALTCLVVCAGLGAVACGGGGEELPPAGTPAVEPPPPVAADSAQAAGAQAVQDTVTAETQLSREVFSYSSSGRDPFVSLLKSGDVRPLVEDLRVTAINYDPRYPGGSVAVLRDTTVNKRYTVRVGDELGRMRITEIRPEEVMVTIQEFGVERQLALRLRSRQEGTP